MLCTEAQHCCSSRCLAGRCDGGCRKDGDECEENFNCCDGLICKEGRCKTSRKAVCDVSNCGGCCEGTVCRTGLDRLACGLFQATCVRCPNGQWCVDGVCALPPGSCPTYCDGCCAYGTCYPGTAAERCGVGGAYCAVCSGSTPNCVSGACAGCQSDADCSSPTPTCSNGACIGCQSDADCANPTPTCDNGVCTGCASDGDCPAAQPFCSSYVCKECLSSSDCSPTGADACSAGACMCGAGAACSGSTPVCSGGTCVGCSSNGDCSGATPVCSSGTCVGCTADSDCSGATPLCCSGSCVAGEWANQTTFGTTGTDTDEFDSPQGIAITSDGLTALIADKNNNRVSVWGRPNVSSTSWTNQTTFGASGSGAADLSRPAGIALSGDGLTAFIADKGNNRISVWTLSGSAWSHSVNFAGGQVSQPQAVAVNAAGTTAWIVDYGNDRVSIWAKVSGTWTAQDTFGGFNKPYGIAVNADDDTAFIADMMNDRISVSEESGGTWSPLTTIGTSGSGASNLYRPRGIVVSGSGAKAWIADTGNNRVSIWSLSGSAWSNQTTFGKSGSAADRFSGPAALAVSADGMTIWISDEANNRVSIWSLSCPA